MGSNARRITGKVGRSLWPIVTHDGRMVYLAHSKRDQDEMMRVNNGKGRLWQTLKYVLARRGR